MSSEEMNKYQYKACLDMNPAIGSAKALPSRAVRNLGVGILGELG